jgi:hypothetical protein
MNKICYFDKTCTEYMAKYKTLQTISDRIDLIIENVLFDVNEQIKETIDRLNNRNSKKYFLELVYDGEWGSYILLKKSKSSNYRVSLNYGFAHDIKSSSKRTDDNNVYFYVSFDIGTKGNGFKDIRERRTFWYQEFIPKIRDEYYIPRLMKDDDPFVYYGIYEIKGDKLLDVFCKRGYHDYMEVVLDAFKNHFNSKKIQSYLNLKSQVKKWKADIKC